jgi:hypothetical protein
VRRTQSGREEEVEDMANAAAAASGRTASQARVGKVIVCLSVGSKSPFVGQPNQPMETQIFSIDFSILLSQSLQDNKPVM